MREDPHRSGSNSGPERLHLDAADALAVDGGDLDVALITPAGAPRVAHDVVVLAVLVSIADSDDGVVKRRAALGGVENTGLVGLED